MSLAPPTLLVAPEDEPRLSSQARALAGAGAAASPIEAAVEVVTFTIAGHPCALPAGAVERAVTRLGPTTDVPLAGGGARRVAWVDEQPVAVTDLAALAGLADRPPAALALAPALLLVTPAGVAAVAVDGPLDLAVDRVAHAAGPALAGLPGLRVAGRLATGATLLAASWLVASAGGAPPP